MQFQFRKTSEFETNSLGYFKHYSHFSISVFQLVDLQGVSHQNSVRISSFAHPAAFSVHVNPLDVWTITISERRLQATPNDISLLFT
jgi:hypothetical protein